MAAVGCGGALGKCPPGMPALPGQLLCNGPSRSQSLPVLHNTLNSSPGTPQARGAHSHWTSHEGLDTSDATVRRAAEPERRLPKVPRAVIMETF